MSSFADTTIANNLTLTADTDWRADGVVTVPAGVTVDLNGHTLWVAGLAGAGTFTSSVAEPSTFDLTTADASKVSSPTTFPSGISPANFFNNNFDRGDPAASDLNSKRIIVQNENLPIIVDYDFGAATSVNSYKVYAGGYRGKTSNQNSGHQRTAKHWKFYGSNDEGDDKAWTPLDERTVTDWNDKTAPDCKQFTFFNVTGYRYYRMEILEPQELSNGFTELVQLEYGHVPNQVRLDLSQSVGFAAASNTVSGTARIVVAGGTLSANVDLRGLGKVTLDGNIDLNGCVVRVAALDGAGKVTSTFSDSVAFDLTTAQTDDTYVKSYFGDNTEPQAFSGQPAWKAFADYAAYNTDVQRVIDTSANFPKHIVYDFQTPTFIDTYKIMLGTANTAPKRAPKTIAFAGSNDGSTWTPLDSRPSETGWSASQERTYSFANERAYRYYRISFLANNGDGGIIEFFRLQYGRQKENALLLDMAGLDASDLSNISTSGSGRVSVGDVVLSDDLQWNTGWKSKLSIDGTIDLHGNELTVGKLEGAGTITDTTSMTDLTDSDASRVWSPNTYHNSNAGTAKDAFSNPFVTTTPSSTATRVMALNSQLPVVIDYDFRTATVVDMYKLTTGDNVQRGPGEWEVFGSNDDAAYQSGVDELSAWKRLDTRFGETWPSVFSTRTYGFSNSTAYRYYRIRFTASALVGKDFLTFWKLQYGCSENCGHLHVDVPSGNAYNRTVSLTGNLRLVKDGDGTFIPVKTGQSYSGGTDVTKGKLTLGAQGDTMPLGVRDGDITVRKNTLVDLNGFSAFHNYGFTLDGGTLKYRGSDVNSGSMITRMRLTDNSAFTIEKNFGFFGETTDKPTFVDLGGHTLEIQISAGKYFRNYNTTYINGTVDITSGGWFLTGGNGVTATDVDFKINCALFMAQQFNVRGYEANFYSTGSNSQYAQMTVAGVFKPTVAAYYGCTMLAGSTMDLTAWPGAWPMASAFGANGKTNLEFADSGEITVNLAGRTDLKALAKSENPYLFTWTVVDGNPVIPGATFVLDPATAAAGYRLRKDATGLKVEAMRGLIIIFN
ncbi:MAG: discoidin domain-containing protein [Kiritimatiellae bacterium]|nr:discoidin domain-containing protein [Kiritimatiellia bacterium]